MKNNIFNLISEFLVILFMLGVLIIVCWYISDCDKEPAKKIGTTVFTEKGHDYLLVDTKHGVCVIHAESCPCNSRKKECSQRIYLQQTGRMCKR